MGLPCSHSPHLYLLLVTIFTSLMEGGCHCCDWMRIWLLIMIYEVLKWLFKWVEEVLVPSWIHKHKCILLSQECFSACDISLLLDSKDVLQRRRKYGGSLLPQQQCHVYVFVAVWLLAMSSYWWCDSKLCLQTCVWLSASFKYVSVVDECALIAKVSFTQAFTSPSVMWKLSVQIQNTKPVLQLFTSLFLFFTCRFEKQRYSVEKLTAWNILI